MLEFALNPIFLKTLYVCALESSCDETGIAVASISYVKQPRPFLRSYYIRLEAHALRSQINLHQPFQGVVPELAARAHEQTLQPLMGLLYDALDSNCLTLQDISCFGATYGPGLLSSLMVGAHFTKTLAYSMQKPFYPLHHLLGHVAMGFLHPALSMPLVVVLVSGGHTALLRIEHHLHQAITLISTKDDALGECFDKVGKIMLCPYPQGPYVERYAQAYECSGDEHAATLFTTTLYEHMQAIGAQKTISDQDISFAKDEITAIFTKVESSTSKHNVVLKKLLVDNKDLFFPHSFAIPMNAKDECGFSFSGLKTAFLYAWNAWSKLWSTSSTLNDSLTTQIKNMLSHAFHQAACASLYDQLQKNLFSASKTKKNHKISSNCYDIAQYYTPHKHYIDGFRKEEENSPPPPITLYRNNNALNEAVTLFFCGGVAANRYIQHTALSFAHQHQMHVCVMDPVLCTDNGAMMAVLLAYYNATNTPEPTEKSYPIMPRWPLQMYTTLYMPSQ